MMITSPDIKDSKIIIETTENKNYDNEANSKNL